MPTINKKQFRHHFQVETQTTKWSANSDDAFYGSSRWRKLRKWMLSNEPLCRECKKKGDRKEATVLDHIHPVRLGGDVWDESNLQPLCKSCHNRKSSLEAKGIWTELQ